MDVNDLPGGSCAVVVAETLLRPRVRLGTSTADAQTANTSSKPVTQYSLWRNVIFQ